MYGKLEQLKRLREELNIHVYGSENYSLNKPKIIIANHTCLMDIFYLPSALPQNVVSLISPRLIYKKIEDRQKMINKYLYAMPIEAHGGHIYSEMCLRQAVHFLENGISVCIFPEGAYVGVDDKIYRGRTGMARILCYAKSFLGVDVELLPVAIDIEGTIENLDSYIPGDNRVTISILEPVKYERNYHQFISDNNCEVRNKALHAITDSGMQMIANRLGRMYALEYISLFSKGNVIFENGDLVPTDEAQNSDWVNLYNDQLTVRTNKIKQLLKK